MFRVEYYHMMQLHIPVLLYDGHCPFCRKQVQNLQGIVGDRFIPESFQEKGVLERFPQLTHEECMKEIKLVVGNGKVLGGAHAIFYTLSLAPVFRFIRWIYPIPGIKQLFDRGYALVASNRYKIEGQDCPTGTCAMPHPKKSAAS